MKLLIFTQKVDKNDDVLGFFYDWIKKLSEKADKVFVIALFVGECDLPKNVEVFSLGKEDGKSRIKYILNFYKYIWKLRKEYDEVFVHMNKEYVLLGWKIWLMMGKKLYFWYNHKKGGLFTRLAIMFSRKVFYTSDYAFPAKFSNSIKMPAGIDTNESRTLPTGSQAKNSILSLGRISPVKNIDVFIDSLKLLNEKGMEFKSGVYGDALKRDVEYYNKIKQQSENLENKGRLVFNKSVANNKISGVYNKYELFVNMTDSGSFDKTILEAMAGGCLVLVCNKSFEKVLPKEFIFEEGNPKDMARKIENIFRLSEEEKDKYREKFREYVLKNHDINILVDKLVKHFNE